MKKIISIILAVLMLLSCISCRGNAPVQDLPGNADASKEYDIDLAFCANDYINPYTCVTKVNRMLSALVYEPLIGIDNELAAVNVLAESAEYSERKINVKLKANILFSDGSPLTSEDVKYSFELAKKSENVYASELSTITDCNIVDLYNLTFGVSKDDPFSVSLLTFPIIKAGSDVLESEDSVLYDPIGTGRYFRKDLSMTINENYRTSDTMLKQIDLINTPDSEALEHNISAGRISVFYSDLADGEIPKMMGKSTSIGLTNLVYVGFNDKNSKVINSDIRQIISSVIDRTLVCEQAFMKYADPATGLYPETFTAADGLQTILSTPDIDNLLAKLESMGYNSKDSNGYWCNESGNIISFYILVNEDSRSKSIVAQLLCNALDDFGIKAMIDARSFENYQKALSSGDFAVYIGEVRFKNNMDVSSLLLSSGSAAFGVSPPDSDDEEIDSDSIFYSDSTQEMVRDFYRGKALFSDILIYFMSEMPIAPICYRRGWLGYDPEIPDNILKPWLTDAYHGIWLLG